MQLLLALLLLSCQLHTTMKLLLQALTPSQVRLCSVLVLRVLLLLLLLLVPPPPLPLLRVCVPVCLYDACCNVPGDCCKLRVGQGAPPRQQYLRSIPAAWLQLLCR